MDERLVQLSDPQHSCGCAGTREKYREAKIVVPIPSANKRDDCPAERDWPAVTFWTPEKSHEVECSSLSNDFAGGHFAAKCGSDQRGYESDHLWWLARIQSRATGFCPILDERLLQCGCRQQRLELRPL